MAHKSPSEIQVDKRIAQLLSKLDQLNIIHISEEYLRNTGSVRGGNYMFLKGFEACLDRLFMDTRKEEYGGFKYRAKDI